MLPNESDLVCNSRYCYGGKSPGSGVKTIGIQILTPLLTCCVTFKRYRLSPSLRVIGRIKYVMHVQGIYINIINIFRIGISKIYKGT